MAVKRKDVTAGNGNIVWEDAPTSFTRRVVMVHVYGDTGTGRTRFALTAPGPIGLCHAGEKIDGVVQQFSRDKQIRMVNFGCRLSGNIQQIYDQANPIWTRLEQSWHDAMRTWAKTLILDTDTEAWELLRLASFGELNPQGRIDALYGQVNAVWRSMFKAQRAQDRCSIITIGQTKDEYKEYVRNGKKSSERTGRTIRAGQKEVGFMSDVVLRTSRSASGDFVLTVEKGWWNAHSEGIEFVNEDITFGAVMGLITETDPVEWE